MIEKDNGLDWSQVLSLKALLKLLKLEVISELSLINKYLRSKLNPLLFNHVLLNGNNLINYVGNSRESESLKVSVNKLSNYINQKEESDYDISQLKNLEIDHIINSLNSDLLRIRNHATYFKLSYLKAFGYSTMSLAYSFINLTELYVFNCSISHISIIKLGEYFKQLKILTIDQVKVISNLKKNKLTLKMINLPGTLEKLVIVNCRIVFKPLVDTIYDLANLSTEIELTPFDLILPINIPNLKSLKFDHIGDQEKYVRKFLQLNPQIKAIEVCPYYLDQKTLDCIAINSSNLTELAIYGDYDSLSELNFPTFNYITNLSVGEFPYDSLQLSKKLISSCPNLSALTLNFKQAGIEIKPLNKFLRNFVSQINSLNEIKIMIFDYDSAKIDINCLNNITKLTIECCDESIYKIKPNKLPLKLAYFKVESWETGQKFEIKKTD
ncbi:hypothetical protein CONCODRAFT_20023 [Conidiobolus coronatus NRRL 28638]|uniref:RNI-like protein n=1 Tax=Conidiobolus coronatus (strain ATCC 28846 / CBS 209.66 / NRRL 28638) TaxID=796925 RepID=A0A137NVN5_CONC2|nr:hypothetical protein CONCODRAFT_20023 [Conidiobolus coronatus NRRL 28638]|eukprot:KXN66817.1 hypothetical protein CONCODRAFT_20023 [Conidiobolus coronatus NRRL 28638]